MIEALQSVGLTSNEADIYCVIARLGTLDAKSITRETSLHKKVVYDTLASLSEKGLVSHIIENGRRVYSLTSSSAIRALLDAETEKLEEKQKLAHELSREIDTISSARTMSPSLPEGKMFTGTSGVRVLYREILSKRKPYSVMGAPQISLSIIGSVFWDNFNAKRISAEIPVKLLLNRTLREYGMKVADKLTQVKILPKELEPLTETIIEADRINLIVWSKKPFVFQVTEPTVANSYQQYFNVLWKQADTVSTK